MKKLLASSGWILLLLPFISMAGSKTLVNPVASARMDSETRAVQGFHSISAGGSFNVYVKLGAQESLRIEAPANVLELIESKVENGTLKLNYKKSSWFSSGINRTANIYITARSLKGLSLSGSGKLELNDRLKTDNLNAKISGSGSMKLAADVNSLNVAISGSGNVRMSGSAKSANIAVSGSGGFSGRDFRTETSDIKVSGSGNISIHADKELNAVMSGSGNISYSGNPAVNQTKSGSGRISKI